MATIVTHLFFARKVLREGLVLKAEAPFLVGNIFPDIRRLAEIERSLTHRPVADLKDVNAHGAFWAGVLFHNLLDIRRHYGLTEAGEFAGYPDSNEFHLGCKFWEDWYLYPRLDGKKYILSCLETVYAKETEFIDWSVVKKYHLVTADYLSHCPNPESIAAYCLASKIPPVTTAGVVDYFRAIGRDKTAQKKITNFFSRLSF